MKRLIFVSTLIVGTTAWGQTFTFSALPVPLITPDRIVREPLTADVTGDGTPDLLVATTGELLCFVGLGNARFRDPVKTPVTNTVVLRVLDLNGDRKADVGSYDRIYFGNGDCTFERTVQSPTAASVFGDVNEDGIPDAIGTAGPIPNTQVKVFLGRGDGTFEQRTQFAIPNNVPFRIGPDLNGDGHVDLLGFWPELPFIWAMHIVPGDGTGFFDMPRAYVAYRGLSSARAGDFNNDGQLDLTYFLEDRPTVALNQKNQPWISTSSNGLGPCISDLEFYYGDCARSAEPTDFDGDGRLDLIFAGYEPAQKGWRSGLLTGKGDGQFDTTELGLPGLPFVADWNRDGRPDLATYDSNRITFYVNRPASSPVAVSSASGLPNTAPGSLATLQGTDLAATAAASGGPWPTSLGGI